MNIPLTLTDDDQELITALTAAANDERAKHVPPLPAITEAEYLADALSHVISRWSRQHDEERLKELLATKGKDGPGRKKVLAALNKVK